MKKQTIQLEKYTAAYTSVGKGTPIIFLHGFFGDSSTLEPLVTIFQEDYHCLSLDLLGFGDSSKPNINYLIEDQVTFLQEFIRILKLNEFYLVGYSYGGWVASAYAIAQSQVEMNHGSEKTQLTTLNKTALKQLVLIAPAGIRDDQFVGRYDHLKPLLWESPLVDFCLGIMLTIAKFIGKNEKIKFIREVRHSLINQPVAKAMISDRLKLEKAIDTVETKIKEITASTLIIAAENDQVIPLWHSQTYENNIPHASLEIIETADHNLIHSHSQKISQLIKQSWLS